MINKNQILYRISLKAKIFSILFVCAICSLQAYSQTVDLTLADTYPSGFPTTATPRGKDYTLKTTDGGTIKLNMSNCGYYSGDGYLAVANGSEGKIKYTTTSVVSVVSVKLNSKQSKTGAIKVLVGTTEIGSQTSLTGGKTYTFTIGEAYQGEGKVITILSSGTSQLKMDQLSFIESQATAPAAPTISPESGDYYVGQKVTIKAASGCSIYYTTDESEPTNDANKYTSPLSLQTVGTTTIKAIAVNADNIASQVATATYNITKEKQSPTFEFSPATAHYYITYSDKDTFQQPTLNNSSDGVVAYASSDESVAMVDNSGEISILGYGTTVITASVAENDSYLAASASYTLHVSDYVETYALVTDASTLAEGDILVLSSGTSGQVGLACNWEGGDRINVDAATATVTSDGLILMPPSAVARLVLGGQASQWTLKDGSSYYWTASGGTSKNASNKLTGSTSPESTSYASISISASNHQATIKFAEAINNVICYNNSTTSTPIFSCYGILESPIYIYRKVEGVEIGSQGVASFSSSNKLRFASTGIKPYTASQVEVGNVTLTPQSGILPAHTGVMIKGEKNTTTYAQCRTAQQVALEQTCLSLCSMAKWWPLLPQELTIISMANSIQRLLSLSSRPISHRMPIAVI